MNSSKENEKIIINLEDILIEDKISDANIINNPKSEDLINPSIQEIHQKEIKELNEFFKFENKIKEVNTFRNSFYQFFPLLKIKRRNIKQDSENDNTINNFSNNEKLIKDFCESIDCTFFNVFNFLKNFTYYQKLFDIENVKFMKSIIKDILQDIWPSTKEDIILSNMHIDETKKLNETNKNKIENYKRYYNNLYYGQNCKTNVNSKTENNQFNFNIKINQKEYDKHKIFKIYKVIKEKKSSYKSNNQYFLIDKNSEDYTLFDICEEFLNNGIEDNSIINTRKFADDSINKKIKAICFKCLINIINEDSLFSQVYITNTNIDENRELNMSKIEKIIMNSLEKKYSKQSEIVERMKMINNNISFKNINIMELTFGEFYEKIFLKSDELKKKLVKNKIKEPKIYLRKFIFRVKTYLEYFSINRGNNKKAKLTKN